jgi:hypothetical protein
VRTLKHLASDIEIHDYDTCYKPFVFYSTLFYKLTPSLPMDTQIANQRVDRSLYVPNSIGPLPASHQAVLNWSKFVRQ